MRTVNHPSALFQKLPVKLTTLLRAIGRLADAQHVKVYLVGGTVRDLILGRRNFDLDLAVEGDGPALARRIAARYHTSLTVFDRFATARLQFPKSLSMDIATTRRESYALPAELPNVQPASLADDLYRRDFTINAMAVQLNGGRAGRLIDCYGGGDDLRTRTIRVLHEKSFHDDPTRIFRAIRFEQRFNGRIEPQTSRLLVEAAATDLIDRLSGPRLRQEWFLLFAERDPLRAMDRVNSLKLMRFLHPELRYGGLVRRVLRTLPGAIAWWEKRYPSCVIDRSVLYLMGLLIASDDSVVKGVLGRLMLSREQARRLRFTGLLLASVAGRLAERKNIPSSQLYRLLDPLPDEALVLSLAEVVAKSNRSKSGRARRRLTRFIGRLRGIKLSLRGNDLLRLGMKPGPQ
ncbi:MAG TPA: hypothetical protein VH681_05740, partial [Nitrospiraceae bacterium]